MTKPPVPIYPAPATQVDDPKCQINWEAIDPTFQSLKKLLEKKIEEGGGGGGKGDKTYVHEQGVTSTEWVINHGLEKRPCVIAFNAEEKQMEAQVVPSNLNTIKLKFNAAVAGIAIVN